MFCNGGAGSHISSPHPEFCNTLSLFSLSMFCNMFCNGAHNYGDVTICFVTGSRLAVHRVTKQNRWVDKGGCLRSIKEDTT